MSSQKFFTEQRHLNEQGLSLYIDALKLNRLEKMPNDLLHHVEQCEECKAHITDLMDIMKEVEFDATLKHPTLDAHRKPSMTYSFVYRIAAVFIIAVFGALWYYSLPQRTVTLTPVITKQTPQQESVQTSQAPSPLKSGTDLLAENFSPSPNLDDLVATEFRSSTFVVYSPRLGEIVHTPITFRWKHYERSLKIKIITNKEITLLTSIVQSNSFVTKKVFVPGLYYWKLEDGDDLLYTGKFFVK